MMHVIRVVHGLSSFFPASIVSTSRCPVLLAHDLSVSSIGTYFRRCGGGEREARGGCGLPSLCKRRCCAIPRAVWRVPAHPVRSVEHAPGAIQVLADQHVTFG